MKTLKVIIKKKSLQNTITNEFLIMIESIKLSLLLYINVYKHTLLFFFQKKHKLLI